MADINEALLQLKYWCVQASGEPRQWQHVFCVAVVPHPSADVIEAMCIHEMPETEVIDDEWYYESVEADRVQGREPEPPWFASDGPAAMPSSNSSRESSESSSGSD